MMRKIYQKLLNLFKLNKSKALLRVDLLNLVNEMQDSGSLDKAAADIISSSLNLSVMRAEDIMIPSPEIVSIRHEADFKEIMEVMVSSKHSRYPIVHEATSEIEGVLFAKDMLELVLTSKQGSWRDFIKPAFIVPQRKRLDILLNEFRKNQNHLAIVIDEYGSTIGVVTIEDVLEEIVGDIVDEHDDDDHYIKKVRDLHFSVNALLTIEDFNKYFNSNLDVAKFDTIGGFVTYHMHKIPRRGERITLGNFEFMVLHADARRIYSLQVIDISSDNNLHPI